MRTIEEARSRLYTDYCEQNRKRVIDGFNRARYLHFNAGFDAAVKFILSLPLSQRLTPEEQIRLKRIHDEAEKRACATLDIDWFRVGACRCMEKLFGESMFKEGGSDV